MKTFQGWTTLRDALSPACRLSPIGPAEKTLARALREPQGDFCAGAGARQDNRFWLGVDSPITPDST